MKRGSTAITVMALFLVLLLVASPAFGGEPKGGSGEQTQVRAGAAQSKGDTSPDATGCDGDMTQDRTQNRTQDQTRDATCDGDGDGTQTQTRSQARTNAAAGVGSEDATQTRTRTRSQFMLESGAASGTVDPESEEPVIEEAQTSAQAGGLLGDVLQAMTRLTERLFTWLGIA